VTVSHPARGTMADEYKRDQGRQLLKEVKSLSRKVDHVMQYSLVVGIQFKVLFIPVTQVPSEKKVNIVFELLQGNYIISCKVASCLSQS
jgi:hypothetical protein